MKRHKLNFLILPYLRILKFTANMIILILILPEFGEMENAFKFWVPGIKIKTIISKLLHIYSTFE